VGSALAGAQAAVCTTAGGILAATGPFTFGIGTAIGAATLF